MKYKINKDKNTGNANCNLKGYKLIENSSNSMGIKTLEIVDEEIYSKIIRYKINSKFKKILELIASICESDEDPGSGLGFALNEVEKFKRIMINKYADYISKKDLELLDKKVKYIEEEVKARMIAYRASTIINSAQFSEMFNNNEDEEEKTSSRGR